MAWIRWIPEDQAPEGLANLYRAVADPGSGQVDHILKIHSLDPEGLKAHFSLYKSVMAGTPTLPRVDREMIAVWVSKINHCHY